MEQSILKSTKEMLGLSAEDSGFDLEIATLINNAFFNVQQLGVTPGVFVVEDAAAVWADTGILGELAATVKTYIFLKVQNMWDPPNTSFMIGLKKDQLAELEVRLNYAAEVGLNG